MKRKWYIVLAACCSIATLSPALVSPAKAGHIVASNDDWVFSDWGFQLSPDAGTFAQNIASWFAGGEAGSFLVYSNHFGLTGTSLANSMTSAGHGWTIDTSIPFNLSTLMTYDGIFLGETPVDNSVLVDYVNADGNIYVFSGGDTEPPKWNDFLGEFGLRFESENNGLYGSIPISSSHSLFEGVEYLYHDIGTSVIDLNPSNPQNQVLVNYEGEWLFAVFDSEVIPEPATVLLFGLGSLLLRRRHRE